MAEPRKNARPGALVPNLALRKVREATGLTIGAFASLVGVSAAYIQAVEIGQRPASNELAEKIRDRTAAWPRSITENWAEPVDVDGNPYTADVFKSLSTRHEDLSDVEKLLQALVRPFPLILRGAGMAGKTSLAMSLVRDKLHEAATRILALDGVHQAIVQDQSHAGKVTVGQLRKNASLARQVNFCDDGTRQDEEAVVLHFAADEPKQTEDLLTNLLPVCAACNNSVSYAAASSPLKKARSVRSSGSTPEKRMSVEASDAKSKSETVPRTALRNDD